MNELFKNANSLGERLYLLRESRNLSQDELAEKLDVSRQTISNWENDKVKLDVVKAAELCRLFNISMDELFLDGTTQEASKPKKKPKLGKTIALISFLCFVLLGMCIGIIKLVHFSDSKPGPPSSAVIISDTGAWIIAIACGVLAICILLYLIYLILRDRKKP